MAEIVSSEPVDFTGYGDYRRGKTFVGQTSKALLAEKADSSLYHRGKRSEERQQRKRADQEFHRGGRSHVSAQSGMHRVRQERRALGTDV